jgi:hypothetical protein
MSAPSRIPSDTFSIGDHITVTGRSKHRGRTATIQKVGSRRLTVTFHDGNRGTYVDFMDAHILVRLPPVGSETIFANTRTVTRPVPADDKTNELARILEQLAITTATAINTGNPSQRQTLLRDFSRSLERHFESDGN